MNTEKIILLTNSTPNHIYWRAFVEMFCSILGEHQLPGKTKPESQHETESTFQDSAINTRKPHVIGKMQIFGQPIWIDNQKANTDLSGILKRNKPRKPRSSQISHLKKCNQPSVFLFFFFLIASLWLVKVKKKLWAIFGHKQS